METIEEAKATIDCTNILRELTKHMTSKEKIAYYRSLKPKIKNMKPSERLIYFKTLMTPKPQHLQQLFQFGEGDCL